MFNLEVPTSEVTMDPMDLSTQLRNATKGARTYYRKNGYFVGETPSREGAPSPHITTRFKRTAEDATALGKDAAYMMRIERHHQGDPRLFDPLMYGPTTERWPHEEMIKGLQGRAKEVRDWARENGLMVTIAFIKSYDPIRRNNDSWYSLVVSWPEEKPAEKTA